jgi:hypothetical protein
MYKYDTYAAHRCHPYQYLGYGEKFLTLSTACARCSVFRSFDVSESSAPYRAYLQTSIYRSIKRLDACRQGGENAPQRGFHVPPPHACSTYSSDMLL